MRFALRAKTSMADFKNLEVWKRAHALTIAVYRETKVLPKDELYGLTSQIRRAVISIEANVAEGSARGTDPEFARFLLIAKASAAELETLLLVARDLGYLPTEAHARLAEALDHVARLLANFIQTVKAAAHSA